MSRYVCVISILSIPYNQNAFMLQMKDASLQPLTTAAASNPEGSPSTTDCISLSTSAASDCISMFTAAASYPDGSPSTTDCISMSTFHSLQKSVCGVIWMVLNFSVGFKTYQQ